MINQLSPLKWSKERSVGFTGKSFLICIRRILHPTDFSPASVNALALAVKLAKQHQAELLLVHVLPPPTPIYDAESVLTPQVESEMSDLKKEIKKENVSVRRLFLKETISIDKQIVRAAKILRADLIVMGTHGRTGVSKFLTGSVASRVIARAPCPVLVVRGRSVRAYAP
ncbi:MAG: universal stress protein [Deltaproteobacteria bacterium]|nr:universal stress protein [Deltaproteobacteria bacterium]